MEITRYTTQDQSIDQDIYLLDLCDMKCAMEAFPALDSLEEEEYFGFEVSYACIDGKYNAIRVPAIKNKVLDTNLRQLIESGQLIINEIAASCDDPYGYKFANDNVYYTCFPAMEEMPILPMLASNIKQVQQLPIETHQMFIAKLKETIQKHEFIIASLSEDE